MERLGPGDQYDIEFAFCDGCRGVVHETLRCVAPNRTEHELNRQVVNASTQPLRHFQGRVDESRTERAHHSHALGTIQEGSPGWGRRPE